MAGAGNDEACRKLFLRKMIDCPHTHTHTRIPKFHFSLGVHSHFSFAARGNACRQSKVDCLPTRRLRMCFLYMNNDNTILCYLAILLYCYLATLSRQCIHAGTVLACRRPFANMSKSKVDVAHTSRRTARRQRPVDAGVDRSKRAERKGSNRIVATASDYSVCCAYQLLQ